MPGPASPQVKHSLHKNLLQQVHQDFFLRDIEFSKYVCKGFHNLKSKKRRRAVATFALIERDTQPEQIGPYLLYYATLQINPATQDKIQLQRPTHRKESPAMQQRSQGRVRRDLIQVNLQSQRGKVVRRENGCKKKKIEGDIFLWFSKT